MSRDPEIDMTFNEAYESVCGKCGDKAGFHRLTRTGNLYCLVYGPDADWWLTETNDKYHAEISPYRTAVRNLQKSDLGIRIGAVLDYNLHSIVNAGGVIG